jgi:hypothetical protein
VPPHLHITLSALPHPPLLNLLLLILLCPTYPFCSWSLLLRCFRLCCHGPPGDSAPISSSPQAPPCVVLCVPAVATHLELCASVDRLASCLFLSESAFYYASCVSRLRSSSLRAWVVCCASRHVCDLNLPLHLFQGSTSGIMITCWGRTCHAFFTLLTTSFRSCVLGSISVLCTTIRRAAAGLAPY